MVGLTLKLTLKRCILQALSEQQGSVGIYELRKQIENGGFWVNVDSFTVTLSKLVSEDMARRDESAVCEHSKSKYTRYSITPYGRQCLNA